MNPLRYRGYFYDTETGLYYLQSRYYDPKVSRFINPDAFATTDADGVLSANMFAYCENNPVIKEDPTGDIALTTLILIGSAVFGVAAALYTGYEMRQAGYGWDDTIFYSLGAGICAFVTVYTLGMSAYNLYVNCCYYYGTTPVTNIGSEEIPVTSSQLPSETQHLKGTSKAGNNATPNGSYTRLDNKGNLYSYSQFDSNCRETMRIDFQGRPHAGAMPHIHMYIYLEQGGRAEYVFNSRWQLIS